MNKRLSKIKTLAVVVASSTLIGNLAHAVVFTGGSITSSVATTGGGSASNSVRVRAENNNGLITYKYTGDINLTSQNGGESLNNSLTTGGGIELAAGESFELSYDFSATLTGGGTLRMTITGITNLGGPETTLSNVETLIGPGTETFQFSTMSPVAPTTLSGSWTGLLEFDWFGVTPGSTLNISIPQNSIDFTAGDFSAVPEPSQFALFAGALGLACVMVRRRR